MNTVNKEGKLTCISQFKIIIAFFSLRISRNNRLREDCNSFFGGDSTFLLNLWEINEVLI